VGKTGSLHSYSVVLADKSPARIIKAHDCNVHDGALILLNNERGAVVVYAAGQWAMAELIEKQDEKKRAD
jgi:hypothetical protein